MKKIAIACDGNEVSQHFGHCQMFLIYEVNENQTKCVEQIKNEGFEHAQLPGFLADEHEVSAIICGRMGKGAYNLFEAHHVEVNTGVSGLADECASAYASGTLVSELVFCNHKHDESHSCGK